MPTNVPILVMCLAVGLLALPHRSSAQTYRVGPGRLVRLTVEEAAGRTQQLQGVVRRSNEDTLRIRLSRSGNRLRAVPLDAIRRLEMSMGRNRAAGTLLGALAGVGTVTGSLLLLFAVIPDGSSGQADGQGGALNTVAAAFWGTVVGAPVGGFIGRRRFAPRRWETIPLANITVGQLRIGPTLNGWHRSMPELGVNVTFTPR